MPFLPVRVVTGAAVLLTLAASCGDQATLASDRTFVAPTATGTSTPSPTQSSRVKPGMEVDLPRVADIFVRFARGELPGAASDVPVGVHLGGHLVRTIPSSDQNDWSRWDGLCLEQGWYAGRTCPFSVLEPLQADPSRVRYEVGRAEHPCAVTRPLTPQQVGGTHVVTIEPRPEGSCVDWVAVELYVNDVAQVVAVNLVCAEP